MTMTGYKSSLVRYLHVCLSKKRFRMSTFWINRRRVMATISRDALQHSVSQCCSVTFADWFLSSCRYGATPISLWFYSNVIQIYYLCWNTHDEGQIDIIVTTTLLLILYKLPNEQSRSQLELIVSSFLIFFVK